MTRIDDITGKFAPHTVGIHIRGTDNVQSKHYSTFDTFISIINKELAKDDGTKFYLATDEEDYKRRLIEIYGDKIIFCPLELGRGTVEGMKGALIDLYCLSRTDFIIGSYFSSFSEIAAEIGGIEVIKARGDITPRTTTKITYRVRSYACPLLKKSIFLRTYGD